MQVGNIVHVYDVENIKLTEAKKKSTSDVPQRKQNRRPLGDICNILQVEKEPEKRVQDEVTAGHVESSPEIAEDNPEQCEHSFSTTTYEFLEKTLHLDKRENELSLKERLFGLTEYVDDVYRYLRNLESTNLIGRKHLDGLEMTEKMRAILVDWMVEVHSHFSLSQETLELSIYILDRYTEVKQNLNKRNAQLIAFVSMFLAAKYEETMPLEVCDIEFVSDSVISQKEIIRAERIVFRAINYNLSRPLTVQFLRRYSKVAGITPMEHAYAMYFCDASLLEYSLVSVRPSLLAAAALFLGLCVSKDVIDIKMWDDNLIEHTSYHLTDFYHILPRIAVALQICSKSNLESVKKKYSTAERYYVSIMPGVQPSVKGSVIDHFSQ